MPKNLPIPPSRVKQIKEHNRKALAENRLDDVLPEESTTRLWEPHDWNAELAKRAKARGEQPNIAKSRVPNGYVMTTQAPEMRDLNQEAQAKVEHLRSKGRKASTGGVRTERPDAE
jgi:hypothetical protein